MDYSAMAGLASAVVNLQTEVDDMRSELDSLVSSLDGQWMGKAQVEFATSYSKLKPQMKEISTILKEFSNQVNNAAAAMQQTDSSIKF